MNSDMSITGPWRKSSRSGGGGAQCVELAPTSDHGRLVRDSKAPAGGTLAFTPAAWAAFRAARVRG